jgi:uncharacterized sulfatase
MNSNHAPRRRDFLRAAASAAIAPAILSGAARRPNILFAVSDDQSWVSTSIAGDPATKTPAFDRVASGGILFTNAICASPGCAPSRAAILTGRVPWQLEEAGTHASYFPAKFQVYPDLLEKAGYFVGITGKGAGPCNSEGAGWKRNPAGPGFNARKLADPPKGINPLDYAGNFRDFLDKRPKGSPFCFWYGSTEPHRGYDTGAGARSGKRLDQARVPGFLPDAPEVRSDLLDYSREIEHFDSQLGQMLAHLEKIGELSNTLVVVTSDNGMSFPGSKATMNEYGIHLPLAMMWPERIKSGRRVNDVISFTDFAPTFLEAAGLRPLPVMTGRSLMNVLTSPASGVVDATRRYALSGRERHSHARFDNLGYPTRAIRTADFLYIRNFKPELWPAGDPELYADIDNGPSKFYMLAHRADPAIRAQFEKGFGKHPAEELYDIHRDPACMRNLAADPQFASRRKELRAELDRVLTAQQDPRMVGRGDIFDSYPRFSPMRPQLGGFSAEGEYNPKYKR